MFQLPRFSNCKRKDAAVYGGTEAAGLWLHNIAIHRVLQCLISSPLLESYTHPFGFVEEPKDTHILISKQQTSVHQRRREFFLVLFEIVYVYQLFFFPVAAVPRHEHRAT